MKELAIFGIIMGCLLSLALQHVSIYIFRKDESFIPLGAIAFVISFALLFLMFYFAVKYF